MEEIEEDERDRKIRDSMIDKKNSLKDERDRLTDERHRMKDES
jgi:hypothetical protein